MKDNVKSRILVAEIVKNNDTVIRIMREVDHGRVRVKIREWFKDDAGEWRPGSAGIEFTPQDAAPMVGAILNAATRS